MTDVVTLFPRQPAPMLKVSLAGGVFDLGMETPEHFSLVVFYRGLHCPDDEAVWLEGGGLSRPGRNLP